MNEAVNNWSVQVAGMALISAAATAVFWVAEGFEAAWPFALVMTAFIAVVHFGRQHSNVLEVMSGTGDERTRSLYTRAVAFAGAIMAWLLPGWWLVTVAQENPTRR
jgi:4-amino-4-deoxy-L-arabinose transferase-like glycosyltransferase